MPRRVVLVVLEGWGIRHDSEGNALTLAHKPNFDSLWRSHPHATLSCSGTDVGLPPGMKGNAEVGYVTLGTGRYVPSETERLSSLIEGGSFFKNETLKSALEAVKKSGKRLHLLGLVSDGNVHSRDAHWLALLQFAQRYGLPSKQLLFHAVLDGRDTGPRAGLTHLAKLMAEMVTMQTGAIATVVGRSYAMDRDANWKRTEQGYNLLAHGRGLLAPSAIDAVRRAYERGESDETVSPTLVLGPNGLPYPPLGDGDSIICFNLGRHRTAQLCAALMSADFASFQRKKIAANWLWLCAPPDSAEPVIFPPPRIRRALCETVRGAKKGVCLVAPPAKREHLEYLFTGFGAANGCRLVSGSSSAALTEVATEQLAAKTADLLVVALTDVEESGHSGSMVEAVKAIERVDECFGRILRAAESADVDVIVTATHGNAEQMVNPDTGGAYPSHTTNPAPFILVSREAKPAELREDGTLADVAPTVLSLLGVPVPDEMEGMDLRVTSARRKQRVHPRHPHVHPEALAAIEAGLREEIDSARFYLLAASTARDAGSKELCLKLAHDEEIHLKLLRERYEKLTGVSLEIPPSPPVAPNVPATFDLTVVEILDFAIESEGETARMFMSLSRKAGDQQASEILRQLAQEEGEHVDQLKQARAAAEQWGPFYKLPERLH